MIGVHVTQSLKEETLELLHPKSDVVFSYSMVGVHVAIVAEIIYCLWFKVGVLQECSQNFSPVGGGSLFSWVGGQPGPKQTSPIYISKEETWLKIFDHFVPGIFNHEK
jgi:hypothetical protein